MQFIRTVWSLLISLNTAGPIRELPNSSQSKYWHVQQIIIDRFTVITEPNRRIIVSYTRKHFRTNIWTAITISSWIHLVKLYVRKVIGISRYTITRKNRWHRNRTCVKHWWNDHLIANAFCTNRQTTTVSRIGGPGSPINVRLVIDNIEKVEVYCSDQPADVMFKMIMSIGFPIAKPQMEDMISKAFTIIFNRSFGTLDLNDFLSEWDKREKDV